MESNGQSYKLQRLSFSSQALDLLKQLKIQCVFKKRITSVLRLGDVWVPVNSSVKHYCAQFYRPKLDNKIKEGDHILKITYIGGESHMLFWVFCIDLYGRLNWRDIGKSDLNYNIKIGSN
jgi:hypothetical protein